MLKDKDTGGRWTEPESTLHINALELMAVFFGLRTLCKHMTDTHVQILIDNITAVAHVNHMGGSHSLTCNGIARNIWLWCITRNIWISAAHIPGVLNVEADKKSRLFSDQTEWKLLPEVFREVTLRLGVPDMDLFATRLNYQCKPFIAWQPDPEAFAIDAFSVNWSDFTFYAFPPFSLLPTDVAPQPHVAAPTGRQAEAGGVSLIRQGLAERGFSQKTQEIIMCSWRGSTQKQYNGYVSRWQVFCCKRSLDPLQADVKNILVFLTELYEAGLGYSALKHSQVSTVSCLLTT